MADGKTRVTVVGAGNVGSNTARRVAENNLADEVVMVDIVEGLPQGLALDINQSAPVEAFETRVIGTNDYAETAGLGGVVINPGGSPKPGGGRMGLLQTKAANVGGGG